jgi:heat shock protein HtpX
MGVFLALRRIAMKWMKGMGLLLIANILIMVTLSVTVPILINVILPMFGIDLRGSVDLTTLVWAAMFGFGGAFISLAFSKQMARAMLDCQQITQPRSHAEQAIYGSVQEIAQRLHIAMPEVWVYDSPDPNAFATGPSRNNSMVAVSTGLLQNLREDEVKAVLAHEMGHVYNGDMFATTVLAGLMNTFVFYIAMWVRRIFAERGQAALGFGLSLVLQIVVSILASVVISWFSRRREFGADAFAARVYGKDSMISALRAIDRWVTRTQFQYSTQDALATMKFSGRAGGFMSLFSTHPPIEARIAALEQL